MTHPEVDRWFDAVQRPWQKDISLQLRRLIFQAVPDITEAFHWSTPAYLSAGPVCWYNTAKAWVNLSFHHGALLEVPPGTWDEPDDTPKKGKRTLKFREGDSVPKALVLALVVQAAENNRVGLKVKFPRTTQDSLRLP